MKRLLRRLQSVLAYPTALSATISVTKWPARSHNEVSDKAPWRGGEAALAALSVNDPRARLRAIAEGNFDDSQINSAAMKTWLAFWASSMHSPQLYRLQQVNNRRLYSNLCAEFKRCLPREQAQLAAKGMAGLIDGLWLRSALSGEHFNRQEALLIIHNYIEQQLNIKYER